MTNLKWIKNQIEQCKTLEELDLVLCDIKADQFENEDYTKPEWVMSRLREQFKRKREQLCKNLKSE